jgi:hypothetical protein
VQCLAIEIYAGSERLPAVEDDIQLVYRPSILQIFQPNEGRIQNTLAHHRDIAPRPETVKAPGGAGSRWDQHQVEGHYSSYSYSIPGVTFSRNFFT